MQWLDGAVVPQHARLRHPRLDPDWGLPRCPTPPGSSSESSSHQHCSSEKKHARDLATKRLRLLSKCRNVRLELSCLLNRLLLLRAAR